jgi:hypothetical protein
MSTKLNFDMWYNFIGKDLKDSTRPKNPTRSRQRRREEDRNGIIDHEWKVAGTPELVNRFQIKKESKQTQTENHKLTICSSTNWIRFQ